MVFQDGSYGIHVNQKAPLGKTSREKVVARADKLLKKISESLIRDQKVRPKKKLSSFWKPYSLTLLFWA